MRGDRLFTFPSFKFQPVNLLMKVQSKVFQVQTLGGIRMDFPLSLVLSHILAIKIRYRSGSCLFLQLHITSPSMLVFRAPTDASFWPYMRLLGSSLLKMEDVDDIANNRLLVCLTSLFV